MNLRYILNTQHRIDQDSLLEISVVTVNYSECFLKLMDLRRGGIKSNMQVNVAIKVFLLV